MAISYDPPATNKEFVEDEALPYLLLSDQNAETVRRFDIRNEEYEEGHFAYGVPFPGIMLIDPDGKIALKLAFPGYKERPSIDKLIEELKRTIQ